jgi:hypothetical protein
MATALPVPAIVFGMTALASSAVRAQPVRGMQGGSATVLSADAHLLGWVDGFVVDANGRITHFSLELAELFDRRRVAVSLGAVARISTGSITLGMTMEDVRRLPDAPFGQRLVNAC